MTDRSPAASLTAVSTEVPVAADRQVTVTPTDPWPSAYRGSRYSVVSSRSYGTALRWSHRGEIQALRSVPDGLHEMLRDVGKPDGYGSVRLTASGEVLTKVPADTYDQVGAAEVNSGYVPVYLGQIGGTFDFTDFSNDPDPLTAQSAIRVWTGLPFHHGESWSVCSDGVLRWRWQDYQFESVFDHDELVAKYTRFRPEGGRLYINEHGHIWGNVNQRTVPAEINSEVMEAYQTWRETADPAAQRLVTRRIQHTESDDAPDGLLPTYLGHLSQFDNGATPKPVISDKRYFTTTARDADQ